MTTTGWITDRLHDIFFAVDSVIYGFITKLYELLLYLANLNLFGNEGVTSGLGTFTQRVYVLLGIFMLFKVSFSILRYLVSPDSFSDKSKGMGKLVTNVLVTLVLLVLTPSIFKFAFDIQKIIISDNVISKLVFGTATGTEINHSNGANSVLAEDMEFLVFGAFFTTNPDISEFDSCGGAQALGTVAMATAGNGECINKVADVVTNQGHVDVGDFFRTDDTGYNRNFQEFGNLVNLAKDQKYYFNYSFGFSTLIGLFVVIMLLSYCIAVAVRAVKLYFLQVIAPIPIVSYIDPSQGKDGAMIKWAKECGKTYVSLFIRLAIIFLSFYLINLISQTVLANKVDYYNGDVPTGAMNVFVTLLLIIGTLIFANQVPKLLENMFGIKFTGEFTVNPLKKIKESSLASGAIAGTTGLATGAVLGGMTAFNTGRGMGKSIPGSIGSGIGGIFSGAVRGAKGGIQGKDKAFGIKSAVGSMGAIADSMKMRKEAGPLGQIGATISEITGAPYKADQYDDRMKKREEYIGYQKAAKTKAEALFDDYAEAKALKANITAAEKTGDARRILDAQNAYNDAKKAEVQKIIEHGVVERNADGSIKLDEQGNMMRKGQNAVITSQLEAMERVARENPNIGLQSILVDGNYSWDAAKAGKNAAEEANTIERNSDKYENAKERKDIRQKSAKRSWINTQNK